MDFGLSEEQSMLVDTIRSMGERENFKELAKKIDSTADFPHHLIKRFSDLGWLGMCLSEEHGGGGASVFQAILAIEELAKFSPMIAASVFESNVGAVRVIDLFGTDAQKKRIIPKVCHGEYSVSVAMTEPEAGSDLTSLSTTIKDEGEHYLLNGRKIFISGGGEASHYLVYARFGHLEGYKGIGAVIVEKGMKGFTFGKPEKFLGLSGMPSCDLIFEDVKVPKENLVIAAGGFKNLMGAFDIERCGNAAMCLGVASAALDAAKMYAVERKAFGRPICEFQAMQFLIVDMAMKLEAARLLVYRAVHGAGRGFPSVYEASMAKCYANEMVIDVTNMAMKVFGGYGYSKEFPVERMLRDGRAWAVAGGTVEMLRITMASILFGRRFDQRA